MNKKLVICGDSFGYGIGCVNLEKSPFGVLTAENFGWDLIRLARGSATNYVIMLQGKFAADLPEKPHLIILSQTGYDRIEWCSELAPDPIPYTHKLTDVNYHQYPPHTDSYSNQTEYLNYYIKGDPEYKPFILSEQVGGIDDCIKVRKKDSASKYYQRLATEPTEKLQQILDYNVQIFEHSIKRHYDVGLILQAYTYIKRKGINCIVMAYDTEMFINLIDRQDLMYQNWGELSIRYPDTIGSLHTGEEGHLNTTDRLIQKIKESGYE